MVGLDQVGGWVGSGVKGGLSRRGWGLVQMRSGGGWCFRWGGGSRKAGVGSSLRGLIHVRGVGGSNGGMA